MVSGFASRGKEMPDRREVQREICTSIIRRGDHPVFRREGDDIYADGSGQATEAALGAKIEVPTIDGRAC